MKVVFRADASLEIGNGHVMRCLTLADALAAHGAECSFACREHVGNLIDYIRARGFICHSLPSEALPFHDKAQPGARYRHWLGADWAIDAEQTHSVMTGQMVDWLVVDHYAISENWEQSMRRACRGVMVIDDLADRFHDCDLLLDQNLGRSAADYSALTPGTCMLLIGSQYALLRPDFSALRGHSLARRAQPSLKEIMISMGGVDKDNFTGDCLEALTACNLPPDCRITVVMGPNAPSIGRVQTQAANMPWPTNVRINVPEMARLMADCDLAIGAAGSTSWERCALGLPSLLVVLADNQRAAAEALGKAGAASVIETTNELRAILQTEIDRFLFDASGLRLLSEGAAAVCDGKGTSRVLSRLLRNDPAREPL